MPGRLAGKVAIVTGASSGIGLSAADRIAREGASVVLVARTKSKLDEAVTRISSLGGGAAVAMPLDVSDLAAVEALPAQVKERLGRVDIVVNNAGLNHRGSIGKHSAKDLTDIITTNLTAPIVLTRAAFPVIERGGAVVFVASLAGMVPVPGEATYSASKMGMRAFARAVAEDFEAKDVHVSIVSPGPVDTGFFGDADAIADVPDLVFSQPMSTADEIGDEVLRAIVERVDEIAIPSRSGRLANAAYMMPAFAKRLRPVLEKRGAANKRAYIDKKRKGLS
jgi:short-subunit dehydrogenase